MISSSRRRPEPTSTRFGITTRTILNVDLADRIRDELFAAFDELARTPGIGHYRRDLVAEPLRFWRVRDYLIIYRSEKRPIEVVRVLHGKRDVQALLE